MSLTLGALGALAFGSLGLWALDGPLDFGPFDIATQLSVLGYSMGLVRNRRPRASAMVVAIVRSFKRVVDFMGLY